MKLKRTIVVVLLGLGAGVALTTWYLRRHTVAVLQPAGTIGHSERNLMIFCATLSIVVVVPVFALLFTFAWRYREGGRHHEKYTPDVGGNRLAETIWWLIPSVLIGIISVVTWQSSYALDPFKPISSTQKQLHIQVVVLDWRWLFIYPDQHVASLNQATIPVGTPVDFEITSDTVMNSFWVPQLGGQMYAMPGMSTHQHLEASRLGAFHGSSANISGKGFAGMQFTVRAVSPLAFAQWEKQAAAAPRALTTATYQALAQPSEDHSVSDYSGVTPGLYDTIVMKYMMPQANSKTDTALSPTQPSTHSMPATTPGMKM